MLVITEVDSTSFLSLPIPILSAIIGALSALIVEGIFWILKGRKNKKERIVALISEAYSISFLINEYFKELVMHKVHKYYWFRASELEFDEKYKTIYYSNHLSSNEGAFVSENKIREYFSQFYKIITTFTLVTGNSNSIEELVKKLREFRPKKPSGFNDVSSEKLREFEIYEEESLLKDYLKYDEYFSEILKLMKRNI
jgi:hypothetical protein